MKTTFVLAAVVLCVGLALAQKPKSDTTKSRKKQPMSVAEVLKKYTDTWMNIPGVVGTGEGVSEGKPSIIVFVERKSETIDKKIPKDVDGFKVQLEETGIIEAR